MLSYYRHSEDKHEANLKRWRLQAAAQTQFVGIHINCDAIKGAHAFDISDEKIPELVGKVAEQVQAFSPEQEALR